MSRRRGSGVSNGAGAQSGDDNESPLTGAGANDRRSAKRAEHSIRILEAIRVALVRVEAKLDESERQSNVRSNRVAGIAENVAVVAGLLKPPRRRWRALATAVPLAVSLVAVGIALYGNTLTQEGLARHDLTETFGKQYGHCWTVDKGGTQTDIGSTNYAVLTNVGREPITILGFKNDPKQHQDVFFEWTSLSDSSEAVHTDQPIFLGVGEAVAVLTYMPGDVIYLGTIVATSDGKITEPTYSNSKQIFAVTAAYRRLHAPQCGAYAPWPLSTPTPSPLPTPSHALHLGG